METKPLYYSVWAIADQKWSAVVLGLTTVSVCIISWNYGSRAIALLGTVCMLLTVWHIFVPVQLELNAQGITRTSLGRTWFIQWGSISGYQIRRGGLLLLAQQDRFPLDPFRSFFLPVPKGLMAEVLYRFRVFVGE